MFSVTTMRLSQTPRRRRGSRFGMATEMRCWLAVALLLLSPFPVATLSAAPALVVSAQYVQYAGAQPFLDRAAQSRKLLQPTIE